MICSCCLVELSDAEIEIGDDLCDVCRNAIFQDDPDVAATRYEDDDVEC